MKRGQKVCVYVYDDESYACNCIKGDGHLSEEDGGKVGLSRILVDATMLRVPVGGKQRMGVGARVWAHFHRLSARQDS